MKVLPQKPASSMWKRLPQEEVERTNSLFSQNGAEPIDEIWSGTQDYNTFLIQSHSWGQKQFGSTTHLTVKKIDLFEALHNRVKAYLDSKEPNYREKVKIVKKVIDRFDVIAMEVFPNQKNVVDQANLYHIWVVEESKFPFSALETFVLPEGKEWKNEIVDGINIDYMIRTKKFHEGKVSYLYMRRSDGQELTWWEKQKIKNELQHESITSVEIISNHGIDKPTCLLCLPLGYSLDFGLHIIP